MRAFSIFLICTLLTGVAVWHFKYQGNDDPNVSENIPAPDPEAYAVTVADIQLHREKLYQQYQQAATETERQEVIESARSLLELTMPSLMRCWLGTPWDFNGTATTPGDGKIACGYYVSTIMRDAGFDVQRIRLAQQPSQNIIRTFLPRQDLQIKTRTPYTTYMNGVRSKPHGVYIIGLDKHVGFLLHDANGIHFLHSGGLQKRVVDESEANAYAIKKSNYRVIGNVTASNKVILKWLLKQPFPTHT